MLSAPRDVVAILGVGSTSWLTEQDAVLDELVFEAASGALREAGLHKHEVGLSVQASMDIYDGRSISSGLTTAAAGGYLSDSYRIEGDVGQAVLAAAQAIAAGDVEVALAVGVYNPEVSTTAPERRRQFLEQISNLAFEPVFDRPIGLTGDAVHGLYADSVISGGAQTTGQLAEIAAAEINRGADKARSARAMTTAAEVLASPLVHGPLTELMLPAHTTGAIAVVLASRARARRARGHRGDLFGWGQATGASTLSGTWLTDPAAAARRAANEAYLRAGVSVPAEDIAVVELSAMSAAMLEPTLSALGLAKVLPTGCVNPSGGVASNFPGLANGGLRLLEALEWLDTAGSGRAVVHSTDNVTGPVAETATVFVVGSL